jgi:hypothetical protein
LLVHGWWFSLGIPASSTTKTGRHDITEILLKVALNTVFKTNNLYSSYCLKQVHSQNPLFSPKTFYLCLINDITEISLKVALVACPWLVVLSGYSGFFHH